MLNPGSDIVLIARLGDVGGLMLFNPQPGSYRFQADEMLGKRLKEGDEVDFSCPICGVDLVAPSAPTLVEIVLKTPDNRMKVARFSRVCGEHATFVSDGEAMESYGEHRTRYKDIDFSDFDWTW